jgi:hypothetical protein
MVNLTFFFKQNVYPNDNEVHSSLNKQQKNREECFSFMFVYLSIYICNE